MKSSSSRSASLTTASAFMALRVNMGQNDVIYWAVGSLCDSGYDDVLSGKHHRLHKRHAGYRRHGQLRQGFRVNGAVTLDDNTINNDNVSQGGCSRARNDWFGSDQRRCSSGEQFLDVSFWVWKLRVFSSKRKRSI